MKPISLQFSEALKVESLLEFPDQYLAHLPREVNGECLRSKPETLGEHMQLVLEYAVRICESNGVFSVIEKLAEETVILLGLFDFGIYPSRSGLG